MPRRRLGPGLSVRFAMCLSDLGVGTDQGLLRARSRGNGRRKVGGGVLTPLLSVSAIKRRSKMEQELEEEMGQARVPCDGGEAATLQGVPGRAVVCEEGLPDGLRDGDLSVARVQVCVTSCCSGFL